ncbi:glycosyl transferase family 2 [Leuconostoc litchii]|uniref:Glycosyltransferase n=1 Tax=Leuconostoc litchii TaxID=1981069 RepID=A0A6P2CKT2_9LACO|nr:glycosyltransferase [Leuconostoc litchii]TYC46658.1 glycosyltransferase [Leuconostoc litchii]GMA70526.1 glycosyl transferase family 2 [Leuconostoc litchii]
MIGAVIVTYNPNIALLLKNINAVTDQVDKLLIVDNGSENIKDIGLLSEKFKCEIIRLGVNLGIAAALNKGIEFFDLKKYDWVLTLDQDSVVEQNTVKKLTELEEFNQARTAILAARFIDKKQADTHHEQHVVENLYTITSGGLVRILAWRKVRGFDEQLFIDNIDNDFNQRLSGVGYRIMQANQITFQHSLGDPINNRPLLQRLLGIKKGLSPTDHSSFRQYYISRNGIIMAKRYFKPSFIPILRVIANTRQIFLFSSPIKKIVSAYKGIYDGLRYNTARDVYFQKYLKSKKSIRIDVNEKKD